ncbi:hypothetical protein QYF61_026370 [Mycteria americana]|uniref:Uncharacterized protein n=1 Tax=Mycteria americana TaxID=33587 RepID=A0AAN7MZR8_MYCAM|nr:hypothetical protein QYF61_026370 [Mycteria americana]
MRVVNHWNKLPTEVVDVPSLETFRVRQHHSSLLPATQGCKAGSEGSSTPPPGRSEVQLLPFLTKNEGQPSWMEFADEGRSWEGAELIPQLSAEDSPTGTASQPFLLSCAGEAQEGPVPRQGTILPHCSPLSQTLYAWNISASRPPSLQLHQRGPAFSYVSVLNPCTKTSGEKLS